MTHTYRTSQAAILGLSSVRDRGRRLASTSRLPFSGQKRSSPNRCGLFNTSKPPATNLAAIELDLDDEQSFVNLLKPTMESQLSVLSTDSGILPTDIRNSSFVDDVIGELTSQGICHSDIISEASVEPQLPVAVPSVVGLRKRKASSPLELPMLSPNSMSDDISTHQDLISPQGSSSEQLKRLKNNEASRKSRANRKFKNGLKEQEISSLEEENQKLSVLLKDFSQVATACKRWLVQKMENPAEV